MPFNFNRKMKKQHHHQQQGGSGNGMQSRNNFDDVVSVQSFDGIGEYTDHTKRERNGNVSGGASDSGKSAGGSTNDKNGSDASNDVLGKRETSLVNGSKILVYLVILFAAAGAGAGTYFFMKREEALWYQDEFEEFAEEVFESSLINIHKTIVAAGGMVDALTVQATHHGDDKNSQDNVFPNITLYDFAIHASRIYDLTSQSFETIAFSPLLKLDDGEIATNSIAVSRWEEYAQNHQDWILSDLELSGVHDVDPGVISKNVITEYTYGDDDVDDDEGHVDRKMVLPIWQIGPTPLDASESPVMSDLLGMAKFRLVFDEVLVTRKAAISPVMDVKSSLVDYKKAYFNLEKEDYQHRQEDSDDEDDDEGEDNADEDDVQELRNSPRSLVVEPVFASYNHGPEDEVLGVIVAVIPWVKFFNGIFEEGAGGFIIDLENTCDQSRHSFIINDDGEPRYLAKDYVHDPRYAHLSERQPFGDDAYEENSEDSDDDRRRLRHRTSRRRNLESEDDFAVDDRYHNCGHFISVHASHEFIETFNTGDATLYTILVVSVFFFTGLVFLMYDVLVQLRQKKVMETAETTTAIVSSLFPAGFQERMMAEVKAKEIAKSKGNSQQAMVEFANHEHSDKDRFDIHKSSPPLASLFPEATIMFGDIVGFTSWSSARDPFMVFTLLETIYGTFDHLADRRGVFKVETIGDCYVAVCGLPTPNRNHASVMARYATDCMHKMHQVVRQLETTLGPETADLSMRIGLHSGPVTAGVLRGQRARFQLFGDAVNTASRIETTGEAGKIHISKETAEKLKNHGKEHWIVSRKDKVLAKGKGEMTTFWLQLKGVDTVSAFSGYTDITCRYSECESSVHSAGQPMMDSKTNRLVDWSTDILSKLIVNVVESRASCDMERTPEVQSEISKLERFIMAGDKHAIDTVKDIAFLPSRTNVSNVGAASVLPPHVKSQLQDYVSTLAEMYNPNSFHNYEHACHVTLSAHKLMSQIDFAFSATSSASSGDVTATITTGLNKQPDPLTKFAFVLAALIHDVDHTGVPNMQLIKENSALAQFYDNKSIAEQNSIDASWNLLMESRYSDLRRAIYTTPKELKQFRQVIVNSVIATDIMDKTLIQLRCKRWEEEFGTSSSSSSGSNNSNRSSRSAASNGSMDNIDIDGSCRRTSIIMENLIQASDVIHTMQHWNIYRKWNEKLFMELSKSHLVDGRTETDPANNWYEGELGFFDHYIIPLAKKLKKCGGNITEECLSYAYQNREEWRVKGKGIVEEMIMKRQHNMNNAEEKMDEGHDESGMDTSSPSLF